MAVAGLIAACVFGRSIGPPGAIPRAVIRRPGGTFSLRGRLTHFLVPKLRLERRPRSSRFAFYPRRASHPIGHHANSGRRVSLAVERSPDLVVERSPDRFTVRTEGLLNLAWRVETCGRVCGKVRRPCHNKCRSGRRVSRSLRCFEDAIVRACHRRVLLNAISEWCIHRRHTRSGSFARSRSQAELGNKNVWSLGTRAAVF
jgi:hypothetical protein